MITSDMIRRGVIDRPDRILVMGIEKIGKSTFASKFPKPFFLESEDGAGHLPVTGFAALTWEQIIDVMNYLAGPDGDEFETLVVDTLDWVESRAAISIAKTHGIGDIGAMPYGEGYALLRGKMNEFLGGLQHLHTHKGMNIVLVAHVEVKKFESPDTPSYDRYTATLHKGVEKIFKNWVDIHLFANYEVLVQQEKDGFVKRNLPVNVTKRVLYAQHRPAADAGSRWPLPPKMELSYPVFEAELAQAKRQMTKADAQTGAAPVMAVNEAPQTVPANTQTVTEPTKAPSGPVIGVEAVQASA